MQDKKKIVFFTIIILILVMIGATYAYFTAQKGTGGSAQIEVGAGTTDSLQFANDGKVVINANQENFAKGKENIVSKAKVSATLKANNATNSAIEHYNVYLVIENNDFAYSVNENTPELTIRVKDPTNNYVNDIKELKALENNYYDITTRTNTYKIASNYEIKVENSTEALTQEWELEVTLINLNEDQIKNAGKTFTGKLLITTAEEDTYKLSEANVINNTQNTYNSITATLDYKKGTQEIKDYYFGIEKLNDSEATEIMNTSNIALLNEKDYIKTDSATYTFTGLEENTNYKIYGYVVDKEYMASNTVEALVKTDEYARPTVTIKEDYTSTFTSITINVDSTLGNGKEIIKYYYSINNGESYEESTSPSCTFNNLTHSTEYHIKVYVEDDNHFTSAPYSKNISTKVINPPSVTLKTIENNIESNYNPGTWTNKNIKVYLSSDLENLGITYQYTTNGSTWVDCNATFNITQSQNVNYQFRIKYQDITSTSSSSYNIKLDNIAPTITSYDIDNAYYMQSASGDYTIKVSNVIINDTGGSNYIGSYDIYYKETGSSTNFILYSSNNTGDVIFDCLQLFSQYTLKIETRDNAGNIAFITKDVEVCCFVAGTKILAESGFKNIEDIKVGEKVWSVSELTGKKELKKVLKTVVNETDELYEITVGNEVIKATPKHRFYVVDKGWVRAYNLKEGDYLINESNISSQKIIKINLKKLTEPVKVYNLSIEDNHNYLVSENELLVHNIS